MATQAFTECAASVTPKTELRTKLNVGSGGGYAIEPEYGCELPAGHAGPHHAVGQTFDNSDLDDLWITWADGEEPQVTALPMCDGYVEPTAAEEDKICPHTYERQAQGISRLTR